MGKDEAGTLAALKALRREVFAPQVAAHNGRIVKLMGDGALVEFPSIVQAVHCAVEVQRALAERNADPAIELRIGINLGDIIIEGSDIYGDGVNVAARIQEVAEPGGVALSGAAYDQVAGKVEATFADGGEHELKNIAKPVRIWRWSDGDAAPADEAAPLQLPDKPSIAVLPFVNMSGDPSRSTSRTVLPRTSSPNSAGSARCSSSPAIRHLPSRAKRSMLARSAASSACSTWSKAAFARWATGCASRPSLSRQRAATTSGPNATTAISRTSLRFRTRSSRPSPQSFPAASRTLAWRTGAKRRPTNLSAYDCILRGRNHQNIYRRHEIANARAAFERAVELDPKSARARAGVAFTYLQDYFWADFDARRPALEHAERAVALDRNEPQALLICGNCPGQERPPRRGCADARTGNGDRAGERRHGDHARDLPGPCRSARRSGRRADRGDPARSFPTRLGARVPRSGIFLQASLPRRDHRVRRDRRAAVMDSYLPRRQLRHERR